MTLTIKPDNSSELRGSDRFCHDTPLGKTDLLSGEDRKGSGDRHNAETAGLDQKQNYGMSKGRPVGSGVTDHKTGHADGGDGGKQGVYKWSPASVRGGYRQHQDAGAEQDHEGKA